MGALYAATALPAGYPLFPLSGCLVTDSFLNKTVNWRDLSRYMWSVGSVTVVAPPLNPDAEVAHPASHPWAILNEVTAAKPGRADKGGQASCLTASRKSVRVREGVFPNVIYDAKARYFFTCARAEAHKELTTFYGELYDRSEYDTYENARLAYAAVPFRQEAHSVRFLLPHRVGLPTFQTAQKTRRCVGDAWRQVAVRTLAWSMFLDALIPKRVGAERRVKVDLEAALEARGKTSLDAWMSAAYCVS